MNPRVASAALALALVLLAPAAHADEAACPPSPGAPDPAAVQRAMGDAVDRGFLWRIEKDGRRSYLYGTVHVARFEWMFPGPAVKQALIASDVLALELDLLDPDIQRGLVPKRDEDEPALPEPLARRLEAQMRAACVEPAMLAPLGLEMKINALSVMSGRRDGLEPAYGIDIFLAGFGRGARKSVVSLETPEAQLAALRSLEAGGAVAYVEAALAELEQGRARPLLLRTATMWADSDEDALMRYEEWCECRRNDAERDAMKRLLDDRNPGLAERIDALHGAGKRVFAAVGTLHMVGPLGLPALLAQRGYRVERVVWRP